MKGTAFHHHFDSFVAPELESIDDDRAPVLVRDDAEAGLLAAYLYARVDHLKVVFGAINEAAPHGLPAQDAMEALGPLVSQVHILALALTQRVGDQTRRLQALEGRGSDSAEAL